MKKTMFITSVIMVVVMAIALTTSSLAWFSATGSADVYTSKMSVQAKAQASSGLQIGNSQSPWYGTISLVEGNSQTLMDPVMPYTYQNEATFVDALINDKFISNKVDQNNKYLNNKITSTSVFFTSEFYITNISQGSDGSTVVGPKYVTPSIRFYKVVDSADVAYVASSNTLDPVLYVAILADHNITTGNGNTDYPTNGTVSYELIKLFASSQANGETGTSWVTDSLTTANFGGAEELFAEGGNALGSGDNASWSQINIGATGAGALDYVKGQTTALQPIYQNNTIGEVKKFKVVAWYDGASLRNSNSGVNFKFELKFSAVNPS